MNYFGKGDRESESPYEYSFIESSKVFHIIKIKLMSNAFLEIKLVKKRKKKVWNTSGCSTNSSTARRHVERCCWLLASIVTVRPRTEKVSFVRFIQSKYADFAILFRHTDPCHSVTQRQVPQIQGDIVQGEQRSGVQGGGKDHAHFDLELKVLYKSSNSPISPLRLLLRFYGSNLATAACALTWHHRVVIVIIIT